MEYVKNHNINSLSGKNMLTDNLVSNKDINIVIGKMINVCVQLMIKFNNYKLIKFVIKNYHFYYAYQ